MKTSDRLLADLYTTTRLALLTLADGGYGEPEEVAFDEELVTVGLAANPTWDAPLLPSDLLPFRPSDLPTYRPLFTA